MAPNPSEIARLDELKLAQDNADYLAKESAELHQKVAKLVASLLNILYRDTNGNYYNAYHDLFPLNKALGKDIVILLDEARK